MGGIEYLENIYRENKYIILKIYRTSGRLCTYCILSFYSSTMSMWVPVIYNLSPALFHTTTRILVIQAIFVLTSVPPIPDLYPILLAILFK